ncbi:TPA: hypothetical protein ACR3Z0_006423 [Bacillus thuringiensis]|uniref:Uncharacterized protein n=4 Tax=Bacillus cereus group TaxID=86661 RepID=A0A9W4A2I2_BACTO|nr:MULTISPECIES: hypothetical protein [Bacillus cereus group]EOP61728.1 hypothetical protein IGU_05636 [Bacillus cereus ISP2954]BAR87797.1 hypothetical protein KNN_07064 [Bacillus thuringiensis serovar tolworthi]AGE81541.1 hypothetical protein HD73_6060 [Bacillus thuringiensis serovar kurstaki str. HD73]AGG04489.1 hypothetical protein H175_63p27 [Bacillus thuringiensis serovar thuringiensis str. IS5056]AHZ55075.1 hypothetical protein YBT1520_33886 [Bacillus thuringiensis serovar kurstaki str. 
MGEIILFFVCVYILVTFAIYMTIKDFYFEQEQSGLLVVLAVCSLPLSAVFTYFIVQLLDYITI